MGRRKPPWPTSWLDLPELLDLDDRLPGHLLLRRGREVDVAGSPVLEELESLAERAWPDRLHDLPEPFRPFDDLAVGAGGMKDIVDAQDAAKVITL